MKTEEWFLNVADELREAAGRNRVTKTNLYAFDAARKEFAGALDAPPVSEPVAWMDAGGAVIGAAMKRYKEMSGDIDRRESAKDYTIPLYTHPTKE